MEITQHCPEKPMQREHILLHWKDAGMLLKVTKALFRCSGHRSGAYLVIDTRPVAHLLHSCTLGGLLERSGAVLYIGSATTLQPRLLDLLRGISGVPFAHGFGVTFAGLAPPVPQDELAILLISHDPGYCLEDRLLTEYRKIHGAWPVGNSRPARQTSRHGDRTWVSVTRNIALEPVVTFDPASTRWSFEPKS
ncbi:MAG: hypothetical protein Q8N10_17125 [Phenylobacterium sp.]|uniref:hypothetical protein n=1 Tax=Phenylobacterium sp. TaxID=1871053 RepID=UPI002727B7CC|nr:hypothetical protein [Phenylobacterium sp.]MDO8911797.1 hypothetical protein [Phenylobacterium sp.]MDP3102211.1 hypothetical protein [Phenylobacterium sp.]